MKYDSKSCIAPAFLRAAGAARYLGVSLRTLRDWQKRRIVPYHKPSSRVALFAVSDLENAMKRFRVNAVGELAVG